MDKEDIRWIQRFSNYNKAVSQLELAVQLAKGNHRKGSDIDLVLKGENLNINDVLKLEIDLDELLLPYLFDISLLHQIRNQDLLEHINRVGKVFYKSTIKAE